MGGESAVTWAPGPGAAGPSRPPPLAFSTPRGCARGSALYARPPPAREVQAAGRGGLSSPFPGTRQRALAPGLPFPHFRPVEPGHKLVPKNRCKGDVRG